MFDTISYIFIQVFDLNESNLLSKFEELTENTYWQLIVFIKMETNKFSLLIEYILSIFLFILMMSR